MFLVNGNNPSGQYDVLISCSMRDKTKVMKFVCILEREGFKVCLLDRDLLVGLSLPIVIPELIAERYVSFPIQDARCRELPNLATMETHAVCVCFFSKIIAQYKFALWHNVPIENTKKTNKKHYVNLIDLYTFQMQIYHSLPFTIIFQEKGVPFSK